MLLIYYLNMSIKRKNEIKMRRAVSFVILLDQTSFLLVYPDNTIKQIIYMFAQTSLKEAFRNSSAVSIVVTH